MVLRRFGAGGVAALASELEVISAARDAQHDAVEAIVILEGAEAGEPEPIGVEPHDVFQVVGGPRHPERRSLLHHAPCTLTVIVMASLQPLAGMRWRPGSPRAQSPSTNHGSDPRQRRSASPSASDRRRSAARQPPDDL